MGLPSRADERREAFIERRTEELQADAESIRACITNFSESQLVHISTLLARGSAEAAGVALDDLIADTFQAQAADEFADDELEADFERQVSRRECA